MRGAVKVGIMVSPGGPVDPETERLTHIHTYTFIMLLERGIIVDTETRSRVKLCGELVLLAGDGGLMAGAI